MGGLLFGVAAAWLGFSKEGQELTAKIVKTIKDKYLIKEKPDDEQNEE
jgi:hypothetical protein